MSQLHKLLRFSQYAGWLTALACAPLAADIRTDGSAGPAVTLPGPAYQIPASLGQTTGANLFHSFHEFNLATQESATFTGPATAVGEAANQANIARVIARVTGGTPSQLHGALRCAMDGADVYLFNPSGILLGAGATLDVSGSFYAASADTLRFADGTALSARLGQASSFSAAAPAAFGFVAGGPMDVNGAQLQALPGKTLMLAGENVKLDGSQVSVPSGVLQVSALQGPGEIALADGAVTGTAGSVVARDTLISASGRPSGAVRIHAGEFELHNSTVAAENYDGAAGSIRIRAQQAALTNGSAIAANNYGSGAGGEIRVETSGATTLSGENPQGAPSRVAANAFGAGPNAGSGGRIAIRAGRIIVEQGAQLSGSTTGAGQGGAVDLQAQDEIVLQGEDAEGHGSFIFTGASGKQSGAAGAVRLQAPSVQITDGARIIADTQGTGAGGDITILAVQETVISGESSTGEVSRVATNARGTGVGSGNAGAIAITTGNLEVSAGGDLFSATSGPGQGGTVQLDVQQTATLAGTATNPNKPSGIFLSALGQNAGSGNGGHLQLRAGSLDMVDGGVISADTYGPGAGGNVDIQTQGAVRLHGETAAGVGSFITSLSSGKMTGAGPGGTVALRAQSLELDNGAQIATAALGAGQGGQVRASADSITIHGQDRAGFSSGVYSSAESPLANAGNAGAIDLVAGDLAVRNHGQIAADTFGAGQGGDVRVHAGHITLADGGEIVAGSQGSGNAGRIAITVDQRLALNGGHIKTATASANGGDISVDGQGFLYMIHSGITTSVRAERGNGGNIQLSPEFTVLDNSQIIAQAVSGDGGNITLNTTGLYAFSTYEIDASSQFGLSGIVAIHSPDVDVTSGLAALPTQFIPNEQLSDQCSVRAESGASRIFLRGPQAVPLAPEDWQVGSNAP